MIRVGIFLLAIISVFPATSKAQQQQPAELLSEPSSSSCTCTGVIRVRFKGEVVFFFRCCSNRTKLDWIFVKPPSLGEPYSKDAPHKFAPHFGRTLKLLNEAVKERISDHAPIMVDLPLAEPHSLKPAKRANA